MWNLEICEDWNIIWGKSYQERWHNLMEKSPHAHVFFHPALVKAWVDTYIPIRNITPLFMWGTNGKNEVFFPLVLWKKNWKNAFLKTIVPVGYSDYDYHDPIHTPSTTWGEYSSFFEQVLILLREKKYADVILIGNIRLFNENDHYKPLFTEQDTCCPYIELDKYYNCESYFSELPKKLREDITKRTNKLNLLGSLSFSIIDNIDEANAALPLFLKYYKERRPNAYIPENLHKNIIYEGLKHHLLAFSQIKLNEEAISIRLAFNYKNRYYSYLPVFNNNYSKLSIGNIHLYKTIEWAFKQKIQIFDLLRGQKSYKDRWAHSYANLYTSTYCTNHFATQIKLVALKLKKYLK